MNPQLQTRASRAAFLARVTPNDGGWKYIGWKRPDEDSGRFSHREFKDAEEGFDLAIDRCERGGNDVYFAVASFIVATVQKPGKAFASRFRHSSNVKQLVTLFADVDFKNYDGDPEKTKHAIIESLRHGNWPLPHVMNNTGGGYHLFWELSRPLGKVEWMPLASRFADFLLSCGLKFDSGVTRDCARLLRVPGTINYKYPHKPVVEIVHWMPGTLDVDWVNDTLPQGRVTAAPAVEKLGFTVDPEQRKVLHAAFGAPKRDLSEGIEYGKDTRFEDVYPKCATLKAMLEARGAGYSYEEWHQTLHLLSFCSDGEQYVHPISDGHATYSPQQTDAMFQSKMDLHSTTNPPGPTTCARFSQMPNSKCDGCPFAEQVRTPLSLAHFNKGGEPGAGVLDCVEWDGQYSYFTFWAGTGDNMHQVRRQLFAQQILGVELVEGEESFLLYTMVKPGGRPRIVEVPCSMLSTTGQNLRAKLSTQHVVVVEMKDFITMSTAFANRLAAAQKQVNRSRRCGWDDDGSFSWQGRRYTKSGPMDCLELDANLRDHYRVRGEDSVWSKVFNRIAAVGSAEAMCLVASSFGAPLVNRFTSNQSVILTIIGNSGQGKSTTVRLAQAVWGDPAKTIAPQSTPNYVERVVGQLNDVLIIWDDLAQQRWRQHWIEMIFPLCNGVTKGRLDANSTVKQVNDARSMIVCCANLSLADELVEDESQVDAAVRRVFEIEWPDLSARDEELELLEPRLFKNHGHLGSRYVRWLVENEELVDRICAGIRAVVKERFAFSHEDRFWRAAVECILAGAVLAERSGCAQGFQGRIEDMVQCLLRQLRSNRERLGDKQTQINDIVGRVIELFSDTRVVSSIMQDGAGRHGPETQHFFVPNPFRSVGYVIDLTNAEIFIPRQTCIDYIAKIDRAITRNQIYKELRSNPAFVREARRTVLAGHVHEATQVRGFLMKAPLELVQSLRRRFSFDPDSASRGSST